MPESPIVQLDHIEIGGVFQLNEAIASLRFYWNLARHKNEKLQMELWGSPKVRGEIQQAMEEVTIKP